MLDGKPHRLVPTHSQAPVAVEWRPIAEFVPAKIVHTEIVLLGWFLNAPSSGYGPGIFRAGVGWWDKNRKVWIDSSDHRAWPKQPTHFACSVHDIPLASGRLHQDFDGGEPVQT